MTEGELADGGETFVREHGRAPTTLVVRTAALALEAHRILGLVDVAVQIDPDIGVDWRLE